MNDLESKIEEKISRAVDEFYGDREVKNLLQLALPVINNEHTERVCDDIRTENTKAYQLFMKKLTQYVISFEKQQHADDSSLIISQDDLISALVGNIPYK